MKRDPTVVSEIKTDLTEDDVLGCVKSLIGIPPVDSTGVISLATAFIYPLCEKDFSITCEKYNI